MKSRGPCC